MPRVLIWLAVLAAAFGYSGVDGAAPSAAVGGGERIIAGTYIYDGPSSFATSAANTRTSAPGGGHDSIGHPRSSTPSTSARRAAKGAKVHDIVRYGDAAPGFEKHHGVLDVWAQANGPGYASRAADTPAVVLTEAPARSYEEGLPRVASRADRPSGGWSDRLDFGLAT